ncbi:MAG: hypothetical protein ACI8PT_001516 [Gammaproteobacteria bacterium]|jgi:hypothetical protein
MLTALGRLSTVAAQIALALTESMTTSSMYRCDYRHEHVVLLINPPKATDPPIERSTAGAYGSASIRYVKFWTCDVKHIPEGGRQRFKRCWVHFEEFYSLFNPDSV